MPTCWFFFKAFCNFLRAALACFLSSINALPCVGSPIGDKAYASRAVGDEAGDGPLDNEGEPSLDRGDRPGGGCGGLGDLGDLGDIGDLGDFENFGDGVCAAISAAIRPRL